MADYGVTTTGFNLKRLTDIVSDVTDYLRATSFGPNVKVTSSSAVGIIVYAVGEQLARAWEGLKGIYDSFTPNGAEGVPLDNICAITGTERREATHTTVAATLGGDPATVIPDGSRCSTIYGGVFETTEEVTIGIGGTVDTTMQAVETGPIECFSGDLQNIDTPISGWSSVTNAEDAVKGEDIERDDFLRFRRRNDLQTAGASTVNAIRGGLLNDVDEVSEVTVFENDTDETMPEGNTPHSVEAIVEGGDDAEIAEKIWELKPAGIATYGNESETITDSMGFDHVVNFSRPENVPVWLKAVLVVDSTFNQGVAMIVSVSFIVVVPFEYVISLNGTEFSYTSTGGDVAADIAAALQALIAADTDISALLTASVDGDDLVLTGMYPGVPFDVSFPEGDDSNMTADVTQQCTGDQQTVIEEIADYADENQGIGDDLILSRYYTPINGAHNGILGITITAGLSATTLGSSNLTMEMRQLASVDSTRIIVDV